MKKVLLTVALVLVVSTSLIAGTLAMYTTSIDDLAEGSAVAKEFVLTEGGTDSFVKDVKIAPSETVTWQFSAKNYDGVVVSETAMDLSFDIDVQPTAGKSLVQPLTFTVTDESGAAVGTATSSGLIEFSDEFALATDGQEKTYTVTVNWPSDNSVDIDYAGADYGTSVSVSVTGTQK
jgi:uncharacterized GH25 family protein